MIFCFIAIVTNVTKHSVTMTKTLVRVLDYILIKKKKQTYLIII